MDGDHSAEDTERPCHRKQGARKVLAVWSTASQLQSLEPFGRNDSSSERGMCQERCVPRTRGRLWDVSKNKKNLKTTKARGQLGIYKRRGRWAVSSKGGGGL